MIVGDCVGFFWDGRWPGGYESGDVIDDDDDDDIEVDVNHDDDDDDDVVVVIIIHSPFITLTPTIFAAHDLSRHKLRN